MNFCKDTVGSGSVDQSQCETCSQPTPYISPPVFNSLCLLFHFILYFILSSFGLLLSFPSPFCVLSPSPSYPLPFF